MLIPTSYLPSPSLARYISNYGILEIPHQRQVSYISPPLGFGGVLIQSENSVKPVVIRINDTHIASSGAVAIGQVTKPVYSQLYGFHRSIFVFLKPLAMYQLFGEDVSALTNSSVGLCELAGNSRAQGLLKAVQKAQNNKTQVRLLNTFFKFFLPDVRNTEMMDLVLAYIHAARGAVTIRDIERNCHCHRKTLERQFRKMIGLTPKVYIQIYQFKCLIDQLRTNPAISWTELANNSGYYDHSHMSRYFKEYLDITPTGLGTRNMEFVYYLLDQDRICK